MKHLKQYEELNNAEPQIGDYVICYEVDSDPIRVDFIKNNIGKIIYDNYNSVYKYLVQYESVPDLLDHWFTDGDEMGFKNCRRMSISEITDFSSNKKDIETTIVANKYNL